MQYVIMVICYNIYTYIYIVIYVVILYIPETHVKNTCEEIYQITEIE